MSGVNHRTSLLQGALGLGVVIVAITEVVSAFGAIGFAAIAAADVAAAAAWLLFRRRNDRSAAGAEPWSVFDRMLLGGVGAVFFLALIVALAAPPNGIDAMGYHMARVVHWIQNGSVDFYPTEDVRQLMLPPFAEYLLLHLVVLSGGDHLVNLVHWSAAALSVLAVTVIARELGAGRRGQVFAAVFAATIPKGLLQATGAKNEWVAALWILCAIHFLLRLRRTGSLADAVAVGSAVGLAILTKVTASLFLLPFVVWLGATAVLRRSARETAALAGVAALVFAAIVAAHAERNLALFGSPTGKRTVADDYAVESPDVRTLISNSVRNVGLQLGTPLWGGNQVVLGAVGAVHDLLGAELNDPRTTVGEFRLPRSLQNEVSSASPLHTILAGWAVAAVLLVRRWRARIDVLSFSAAVLAGFGLFSGIFRWQLPNSRLMLPLFVLGAPVIGVLLEDFRRGVIARGIAATLVILAPIWILFSDSRPLIPWDKSVLVAPRQEQYFAMRPELRSGYFGAAERIRSGGHRQLGLVIRDGYYHYEYPIWKLLESSGEPVRIEHVLVTNESAQLFRQEPFAAFQPSALLVVATNKRSSSPKDLITLGETTFVLSWQQDGVALYELPPRAPASAE